MNRIISVTINGIVFRIEEDAYSKLKNYLDEIKTHFAKEESSLEIISDIEAGIAEKFKESFSNRKDDVILIADVEKLILEMGRVEDIVEEKKSDKPEPEIKIRKRLYRDPDDMFVAGVCSGLAAYFGIDPTFVRIAFVILTLINGIGILAYLILWLIVPMAKTSAQKLEMKGETANLNKIKEFVTERANDIKNEKPVRAVGKFFQVLAKVFLVCLGIILFIIIIFILVGFFIPMGISIGRFVI